MSKEINQVIYFGKVPSEFYEYGEYFEYDDNYFYFKAIIDDDGMTIYDSCNRIMPFDYSQLKDLANLSAFAYKLFSNLEDLEKDYEDTYGDIVRTLAERYGLTS